MVVEPVQVPGHVAEGEGVHLARGGGNGGVEILDELGELLPVVVAGRQVDVAQHQHPVVVLSLDFLQLEVDAFRGRGIGLELRMEPGQEAAGEGLVAARGGDEHVAVEFLGLHLVHALGVRLHHFHAVRDHDAREAGSFAGDLAVYGAAGGGLDLLVARILDDDVHRPFPRLRGAALVRNRVGSGAEALGPDAGDGRGEARVGNGGDRAGVLRGPAAQDDLVAGHRRLRELDAEADLGGAIVDGHLRGNLELDIDLFLLGIVFLAGRNQEKDGQEGQDKIYFFHYLLKVHL